MHEGGGGAECGGLLSLLVHIRAHSLRQAGLQISLQDGTHTHTHTQTQTKCIICPAENDPAEFSLRKRNAINKKALWHTHSRICALLPQSLILSFNKPDNK